MSPIVPFSVQIRISMQFRPDSSTALCNFWIFSTNIQRILLPFSGNFSQFSLDARQFSRKKSIRLFKIRLSGNILSIPQRQLSIILTGHACCSNGIVQMTRWFWREMIFNVNFPRFESPWFRKHRWNSSAMRTIKKITKIYWIFHVHPTFQLDCFGYIRSVTAISISFEYYPNI